MSDRADAHIHLFDPGYPGSFPARPGVKIDEVACYASLAADHDVCAALVVAYEGDPRCAGNNRYLADILGQHDWIHATAYFDAAQIPSVDGLAALRDEGFIGLSLYIFSAEAEAALQAVPDDVWRWLVKNRWLISVNSRGAHWQAWYPVIARHGDLRLIASHLGLPPCADADLDAAGAAAALATVTKLAEAGGAHVKLSGFYVMSDPGFDYPHHVAWPYVETLLEAFGTDRLLWASDFMPALDHLSFGQTYGLFAHMPFLDDAQRRVIEGENLLRLLGEVG